MSKSSQAVVEAVRSVLEPLETRRLLAAVQTVQFLPSGTRPYIDVTFNAVTSGEFNYTAFHVQNLTQDTDVAAVPINFNNEQPTNRWALPTPLATGWYETYMRDESLDTFEYEHTFSFLAADFDGNHTVDFTDFSTLQNNFGLTPATFAQGDANYDHTVDFNDYLVLQNSFGQTLPALSSEPGSVSVANTTPGTLTVGWTANTDVRDGFKVYRSDDWGNNYSLVKTIADPDARTWTDGGPGSSPLTIGKTYWYRVRAYTNAAGASASTQKASGVVPQPAPTAVATPDTVTGTTTQLGVLGDTADPTLNYTWTRLSGPAAVTFGGPQNTNAAKNTLATFTKAGTYTFSVAVRDGFYNTVVSQAVTVEVTQTAAAVEVTPSGRKIPLNGSLAFTASVTDQFGRSMANAPITWAVASGPGSMSGATFTASSTPGTATVQATCGTASATATLTVEDTPFNIQPIQALSTTAGQSVNLAATFLDPRAGVSHTASIDWGDGHVDSSTYGNGTSVTEGQGSGTVSGSHTFTRKGNYTGTLRMTDSRGQPSEMSFSVTVAYVAPTLSLTGSLLPTNSGFTELTVQIKVESTDPANITGYKVEWGDGTQNQFSSFSVAPFDGGTYVTLSHLAPHPSDEEPWTVKAWVSDSEPEPHYAGMTTINFLPIDYSPEIVDNIHVAPSPSATPPHSKFNTPLDDDYEWGVLYDGGHFEQTYTLPPSGPTVYYNVSLYSQLQLADGRMQPIYNDEDGNRSFATLAEMTALVQDRGVTGIINWRYFDLADSLEGAHVEYWRGPDGLGGPGIDLNLARYKYHDGIHIEAVNSEAWEPSSGHSSDNTLSFKVTQGTARPYDETYAIYTPGGTATNDADYSGMPQTVTIPAGETTATFQLNVLKDHQVEGNQTVSIRVEGYRLNGYEPYNVHYEATAVIHDAPVPAVTISRQGSEIYEGQSKAKGDSEKAGFWVRRGSSNYDDATLTVDLQYGGNAVIGKDVWGVPSHVDIPAGKHEVFVPVGVTEDVVPEWTELFQVKLSPSASYSVANDASNYVSWKVYDDDYFYVGTYQAPETTVNLSGVASPADGGASTNEDVSLETVGNEFNAVVSFADGDWIPWLTGEATSDGSPAATLYDGTVDAQPTDDEDTQFTPSSAFSAALQATDPMVHARNLSILEEIKPGFTFTVAPDDSHYIGTDAAGRVSQFNLDLAEVNYIGTHQGFYLKFNDDGSIDKWGGEFVNNPQLIERVRKPYEELQRELSLQRDKYFQKYNQQTEEHRIMREQFDAFRETVASLLQTVATAAPGATTLDIETAVTGKDPFNPGVQVSGGSRAMSAASAGLPIVGIVTHGKKLLTAAEQLRENWSAGMKFEKTVIEALNAIDKLEGDAQFVKNTKKIPVVLKSGKLYKTIPDIFSISSKSLMEIKRRSGLPSLTNQIEAQITAAKEANLRYRIILGPDAILANIAPTVTQKIEEILGANGAGSIVRFNADTRKLERLWP